MLDLKLSLADVEFHFLPQGILLDEIIRQKIMSWWAPGCGYIYGCECDDICGYNRLSAILSDLFQNLVTLLCQERCGVASGWNWGWMRLIN